MKTLTGSWSDWPPSHVRTSVTIGVLDGVHRGHQALIEHLDPGLTRTVLTFEPHPLEVLRPGTPPRLITTVAERVDRLGAYGVEQVGVLDLREVKDLPAREFVERVLLGRLSVGQVVVGPDFRFGKGRQGDVETLAGLATRHGFEVTVIELIGDGLGAVSSSRIRDMIEAGQMSAAENAMGARFVMTGLVIEGDARGRAIGFPTANMRPPKRKVLPATGVYAAFAHLDGAAHSAAVNVGVRPTFDGDELLVEAFLLDFSEMIYGELLTVEFVEYLRPEERFGSVEELVRAMEADVEQARGLLKAVAPNVG